MIIQFPDDRTVKLFNSAKALNSKFGPKADKIRERLAQLEAASCLADLRRLPGKWHELKGDRKGQVAAHLTGNFRLIIQPADAPMPRLPDGGMDWASIKQITVLEVVDYH